MSTYLAAIDCGTTYVKSGIFAKNGKIVTLVSREVPCAFGADGAVSQDPEAVGAAGLSCLKKAIATKKIPQREIAAVAVSGQRASVICTGRDGKPLGDIISWQDLRGPDELKAVAGAVGADRYLHITGIPVNPVFSLAKILYLKKKRPALYKATRKFVTVGDFMQKTLGAGEYLTDRSNASLTGMLDIEKLEWSEAILSAAGIGREKLPQLTDSGKIVGKVSKSAAAACGLLAGTPIVSGGGDQQCAAIGAGALAEGVYALTFGTCSVLMRPLERPDTSGKGVLFCTKSAAEGEWLLEGFQTSAGAAINWFKTKVLGAGALSKAFLAAVAGKPPGAEGIIFFPHFAGASAPVWNDDATGACFGLKFFHDRHAIARALFEAIAFETRGIMDFMRGGGKKPSEIRVSGGYSNVGIVNRIYCDALDVKLAVLESGESSLLGAAMLAAVGAGVHPSLRDAAREMVRIKKTFEPDPPSRRLYEKIYDKYRKTYAALESSGIFQKLK